MNNSQWTRLQRPIFAVLLLMTIASSSTIQLSNDGEHMNARFKRQLDIIFSDPGGGPIRWTGIGWGRYLYDPSMTGQYTSTADIWRLNLAARQPA